MTNAHSIVYNSDDNDDDDYTKVFATSANCHIEDPDDDILSICDIDIEPIAGSIYERAPLQRQLVDLLSLECRRGFEYNSDDERTAAELHNEFIAKEKSDDLSLDDWVYCDIYGSDNDAEVAELRHLADAAREEEMLLQTSNTMGVPLSVDTELETEMGVDIGWGRKLLKLLGAKEKKWRVTASMYHV